MPKSEKVAFIFTIITAVICIPLGLCLWCICDIEAGAFIFLLGAGMAVIIPFGLGVLFYCLELKKESKMKEAKGE